MNKNHPFKVYLQEFFRPSRFTSISQVTVAALSGSFGFFVYLLGQRLATAKGRVHLGWATAFLILTLILNAVLWYYTAAQSSEVLGPALRALSGLLFVALYSSVKHPEDQGIPDTALDLAPVLPTVLSILLGLMLESGFSKVLQTFVSF